MLDFGRGGRFSLSPRPQTCTTMKQKIKVYQIFADRCDKNGNYIPKEERTIRVACIGTVITPKNERPLTDEAIWDLFNWTCWGWGKLRGKSWIYGIRNGIRRDGFRMFPTHNARGYCNSDIFFKMNNKWYAAQHYGFATFDTMEEAKQACIDNIRI